MSPSRSFTSIHLCKILISLDEASEISGDNVAQFFGSARNQFVDALFVGVKIRGKLAAEFAQKFIRLSLDQLCLDASHTGQERQRIYKSYDSVNEYSTNENFIYTGRISFSSSLSCWEWVMVMETSQPAA